MKFKSLRIENWKQYRLLDLEFHSRVTVLTGANGSGKTTILNLLSRHFGWNIEELRTPTKDEKTGKLSFLMRWLGIGGESTIPNDQTTIGEIVYDNNTKCLLKIPKQDSPSYQITFSNQLGITGLLIPSHRSVYRYAAVTQINTQKRRREDVANQSLGHYRNRYLGGHHQPHPENYFLKETLLAWAISGFGNAVIERDPEQMQFYTGFETALKKVLPEHIGFKSLAIRNWEVVLVTDTGEFMLDAASGGLSALIDISWQIYLFVTAEMKDCTILIDEIENHLHANMQRRLLPTLAEAFPTVQFIVTTHSPLIVGSVRDSSVYALRYDSTNKVYSTKLDLSQKAAAANDILREVLGVPFTMPIWVEDELARIVTKYGEADLTEESLRELRSELSTFGLGHYLPQTLAAVVKSKKEAP